MKNKKNEFCYQVLMCDKDSAWHYAKGFDDMSDTGCYKVRFSHKDTIALGLSSEDCCDEHYMLGYLFVTESGTDDKLQKNRVVGQTLLFTNCSDKRLLKYTRMCNMSRYGNVWGKWVLSSSLSNDEIKQLVSDEVSKITETAPEVYEVIKELSEWVSTDGAELGSLLTALEANTDAIENETNRAKVVENLLAQNSSLPISYDIMPLAPDYINGARIVYNATHEWKDGDVLRTVVLNCAADNSAYNLPSKLLVYSADRALKAEYELGTFTSAGTHRIDVSMHNIILSKGDVVALKNVWYAPADGCNDFYDFESHAAIEGYAYLFGFDFLRIMQLSEYPVPDKSAKYINGARIVYDPSHEWQPGDVLKSVILRTSGNSEGLTTTLNIYSADGKLLNSYELGDFNGLSGEQVVDVSNYNICLDKGYRVAIKNCYYSENFASRRVFDIADGKEVPFVYDYLFGFIYERTLRGTAARLETIGSELKKNARKRLKVLCIGNSFSEDSFAYVPMILKRLAPELETVIGIAYKGGATLDGQQSILKGEESYDSYHKSIDGGAWATSAKPNANVVLDDEDWDIITLQQGSDHADGSFDSYYKEQLVEIEKLLFSKVKHPVTLGWVSIHSKLGGKDSTTRWGDIILNTQKVMRDYGFSLLFPYGTAVQNLRTVLNLGNGGELTADGAHLQDGIGCLSAAYSHALVLLKHIGLGNIGVVGDDILITDEFCDNYNIPGRNPDVVGCNYSEDGEAKENLLLAQKAALSAVASPYAVINPTGESVIKECGVTDVPLATADNAGAMSAEDKIALDTATSRALRQLFIAAGAEYNGTGADKTKTTSWGESVVHKAGHYYLNGLGDITEEQMLLIYNAGQLIYSSNIASRYTKNSIRTNIIQKNTGWTANSGAIDAMYMFYSCSNLETCVLSNHDFGGIQGYNYFCFQAGNIKYMFDNCKNLKAIEGVISCETGKTDGLTQAFARCPLLKYVNIYKLNKSISFAASPNLDKGSILYAISNASPTSAITITLHADAYALLANDEDIVAALEAQSLVTLVSA